MKRKPNRETEQLAAQADRIKELRNLSRKIGKSLASRPGSTNATGRSRTNATPSRGQTKE